MKTFIYYLAERFPGQHEMQRFASPIHVGLVTADNIAAAYDWVVAELRPTLADHPQLLEVRFEEMTPPRSTEGSWRRHKAIDMDITFA